MNVLKNNIKIIVLIIILILISSGISVFATSTYFANQVSYTTNKNAEIKTVEEALNDLYKNKNKKAKITNTVVKEIAYLGGDGAVNWNEQEYSKPGYGTLKIDATNIPNYEKLSINNFSIVINRMQVYYTSSSGTNNSGVDASIVSYENGILTINIPRHVRSSGNGTIYANLSIVAHYIDYE